MSEIRMSTRKVRLMRTSIYVSQVDIDTGECRKANKCMIKVAIERKLRVLDPDGGNHHVKVDKGHIRYNYKGFRYKGDTPKLARKKLQDFDDEDKERKKCKRMGVPFRTQVEPFPFILIAAQMSKIIPHTRERQDQINNARRRRVEEGKKDVSYTLHRRVAGFV